MGWRRQVLQAEGKAVVRAQDEQGVVWMWWGSVMVAVLESWLVEGKVGKVRG